MNKFKINISSHRLIILLVALALPVSPARAAGRDRDNANTQTAFSVEVITTFDYPGTGNSTFPQKINERGDIVGSFLDSSGVSRGFVRFSDGSFSAPIVDPNDTVYGFTEGRGINNLGTVCGDYFGSDGNNHGFFLSSGTFT